MAKQGAPQRLPSPNPKYPFVGPNYLQYGEQPGYVYYPWSDEYYVDPKAVQQYGESAGLVEKPKEPPGLAEQLLPVGLGIGAAFTAKEVGSAVGNAIGNTNISGLLGLGESAPAIAGGGAANAGGVAASASGLGAGGATAGTAGSGGLIGLAPAAEGAGAAAPAAAGAPGAAASSGLLTYGAPIVAAIAAGYTYKKAADKYKTTPTREAAKKALKDPLTYLIPTNLLGAVFGDKDMYLTENVRLQDLKSRGIAVPEGWLQATALEKGRSIDELVKIEQDKKAKGQYSNEEFARTRDVSKLKPEDIWGYSAFLEKYGNDWLGKFSEQQRREIAQKALDAKAVTEHHGTIDIDWSKVEAQSDKSEDDMKLPSNVKGMPKPVPGQQKQSLQQMGQQYGERPIQTLREVPKVPPPQSEQAFREMVVQNGLQGAPQAAPQNRAPVAAPQPSGLFGIASKPVALPPGRNQLYSQPGVRQALDQMRSNRR